ncbi:MAG: alpha/beta fold hydrolase [Desulfobacterales bacterium]
MNFKKLTFANRFDQKLSARFDLPVDGKPLAYAIFAHCFTCTKNLKAVGNISRALNRAGIAVMRFDFTGLGESEGDFADTNFTTNVSDLVDAADFLAAEYQAPEILIGHSLGGAAVIQAAAHIESAKAVAVIGAPANADHVLNHMADAYDTIKARGEAEVRLAGRPFKIKKQFIDDLESHKMADVIARLKRALMILHSPIDQTVGIENAAAIFKAAKHPKSFISLDQSDHLLSRSADSEYAGTIIAAWARKYITALTGDKARTAHADNQVIARTGPSGYMTDVVAGRHSLTADEPVAAGGTNLGPTPYDFLLAGLGACTSITLRMYADRKQWPLEGIEVVLRHQKIHADNCRECETKSGYLDEIKREIKLEGNLDETQRQRLLQIADRCPVHRTLHSEIRIDTDLTA